MKICVVSFIGKKSILKYTLRDEVVAQLSFRAKLSFLLNCSFGSRHLQSRDLYQDRLDGPFPESIGGCYVTSV